MKFLNPESKFFLLWNLSTVVVFLIKSSRNLIGTCQRMRPDNSGPKLFRLLNIAILGTLRIEISSWKIFYSMKQRLSPRLSILDLVLVSRMIKKSKCFVERQATWLLKSFLKLNMQEPLLIYGLLVCCYTHYFPESFLSKA